MKALLSEDKKCRDENDGNKLKNNLIGAALAFTSAFLLLLNNTILKKIDSNYTFLFSMRFLFQIIVSSFMICKYQPNLWIWKDGPDKDIHKYRIWFLLVPILSAMFDLFDLVAVLYMPIGDAMTIIICSAVPTVLFAAMFLNERLRLYKFLCTLLVTLGIVLVLRPPFLFQNHINSEKSNCNEGLEYTKSPTDNSSHFTSHYYIGAVSAFSCMMTNAIFRTMMRLLIQNNRSMSSEVYLLYHGLWNLSISIMMPFMKIDEMDLFPSENINKYDKWTLLNMSIYAMIGLMTAFLQFKAHQFAGPVVIGFVRTTEIIFAYVDEIIFFHTVPYLSSLLGAIFIIIACIGVLLEDSFLKFLPSNIQWIL